MRDPRYPAKLTVSLAAVYLIWGSSFLFTKIAVTNLPFALALALRFLAAGILLAAVARLWRKDALPQHLADWRHAVITGFFMVFINNGLNAWAIQYIPTNEAALLNGTAAFWITGLGVWGPRGHPLTRAAVIGLGIGFVGTALTLIPKGELHATKSAAELAALGACLAFSLGTLYYRSIDTGLSSLMFMAMQLSCGGLMLLATALLHGDIGLWHSNAPGLLALVYLTIMSSSLAFTAYGWLTRNSTPAIIGTYSYVNPAVAAFLGWEFLHETLSRLQLIGMSIVMIGVVILTMPHRASKTP